MTTATREQEINNIHKTYADFYRIGGGLSFIVLLAFIGGWIFGQNQFALADTMLGYVTNFATEALSVVTTIVVIDQLNRRRERQQCKEDLIRQAGSIANSIAVDAVEQLRKAGWLTGEDGVLKGAELRGANLEKTRLEEANLQEADLRFANLQKAILEKANLRQATLEEANLRQATLVRANLQQTNMEWANLEQADLRGSNLKQATVSVANLKQAKLDGANLEQASLTLANLQQAAMTHANLQYADLRSSNLQQATVSVANLKQAKLGEANLQGTNLWMSNLSQANLSYANLQDAYLVATKLQQADLYRANLRGARYTGATIYDEQTVLPDAKWIGRDAEGKSIYDKYWTPETDMTRYTNPEHPDFWEPEHVKPDFIDTSVYPLPNWVRERREQDRQD